MDQLSQILTQHSILKPLSHYVSLFPRDLKNLSQVFPNVESPKNLSEWDTNVLYLQSLQQSKTTTTEDTEWKKSSRQGVEFSVSFNQKNRKVSVITKSIEIPSLVRTLPAGEINIHKFDNGSGFCLHSFPPALTKTNKFEYFLVSIRPLHHQNKQYYSVIRVTELNKIESFLLEYDLKSCRTKTDPLNQILKKSFSISESKDDGQITFFENHPIRFDVNYITSFSGASYYEQLFHKATPQYVIRDGQRVSLPLKEKYDNSVKFIDDNWILYSRKYTFSSQRSFYALPINPDRTNISKLGKLIVLEQPFEDLNVFPIGKSFVLVVKKEEKQRQTAYLFNLETNDEILIPIPKEFGKMKSVYMVNPGVFKVEFSKFSKLKNFITLDVNDIDIVNKKLII